jgi:hypothetical protein
VAVWKEVLVHFLNTAWKPFQPPIQQDFEGFEGFFVVGKETGCLENQWGLNWTRMM